MGFDITHVYGLTETYGPATVCAKHESWNALDIGERARLNSRQGVRYHLQRSAAVLDPKPCSPCRATARPWARSCSRAISP
jgi:fatty-acyl-CoA synthase